jgi:hypothetical protein
MLKSTAIQDCGRSPPKETSLVLSLWAKFFARFLRLAILPLASGYICPFVIIL